MDEKEVAAVQVLKTTPPTNIKELRKLLGFRGTIKAMCLTNPPVMVYPRFEDPFILHTDASERD